MDFIVWSKYMRTQRQVIADMLSKEPQLRERKYRFVVASRMSGVDEDTCKMICSIVDEFRHQTKADEVGLAHAEEWKSQQVAKETSDWDSTFKRQFNNPLA